MVRNFGKNDNQRQIYTNILITLGYGILMESSFNLPFKNIATLYGHLPYKQNQSPLKECSLSTFYIHISIKTERAEHSIGNNLLLFSY